jgi:hypothetical protein
MALRLMLMLILLSGFGALFTYQQMQESRKWQFDKEMKKANHYEEFLTRSSVHLYFPSER